MMLQVGERAVKLLPSDKGGDSEPGGRVTLQSEVQLQLLYSIQWQEGEEKQWEGCGSSRRRERIRVGKGKSRCPQGGVRPTSAGGPVFEMSPLSLVM